MVSALLFFILQAMAADSCTPPIRYLPLPGNNEGMTGYGAYMRVHPSGKYIMLSSCVANSTTFHPSPNTTNTRTTIEALASSTSRMQMKQLPAVLFPQL